MASSPFCRFNRIAPGAHKEDEEDLAWPNVNSEFVFMNLCMMILCVPSLPLPSPSLPPPLPLTLSLSLSSSSLSPSPPFLSLSPFFPPAMSLPDAGGIILSQEDIDNHNKEDGSWAIIHGKVYDVQSLALQVWLGQSCYNV